MANGKARRYATRTPLQDYSFFVGKYKSPLKSCAVSDIFKPGGAVSVDLDQGVGIELGFLGKVLPVESHEMIPLALSGAPPAGVRVLIATRPVDFRRGADSLAAMASEAVRLGVQRVIARRPKI